MKKFLLTALFSIASLSVFAGSLDDYPQVRTTLNNDNLTLYSYWGCLEDGYQLSEVDVQPIYYIVAPTGRFQWGTATIRMYRSAGGPNSLQTEWITMTVAIYENENGQQEVESLNATKTTVF